MNALKDYPEDSGSLLIAKMNEVLVCVLYMDNLISFSHQNNIVR
jgi:hypothetical protein